MAQHANTGRQPGAATSCSGNDSASQNSATISAGQAVILPALAAARARLLEVIRQRPKPKPAPVVIHTGRRADAVRILRSIPGTKNVAIALRVAPSTVWRWRAGACVPTVRHWRKLRSLRALTWEARP